MKSGMELAELAYNVRSQRQESVDYVVDSRSLEFLPAEGGGVELEMRGQNNMLARLPVRTVAHEQFASTWRVPKPYYDRMLSEAPDLFCSNLNHWLNSTSKRRLVRTLGGQVRAVMSDRYRPLDNLELFEAIYPTLMEVGANVVSGNVSERLFTLQAVSDRISGEVVEGDVIQAGVTIRNSEVGAGRLRIEELDYRLICANGMIRGEAVTKRHVGKVHDSIGDFASELLSDETKSLEDQAFFGTVRDVTAQLFTQERLDGRLKEYTAAASEHIEGPLGAVATVSRKYQLTDTEHASVIDQLIGNGPSTKWGLANAVTRIANDAESYDRSTELQDIGGRIISSKN